MKEVKKKKPGKREAARDLMREHKKRCAEAFAVGPLKPWSGIGCTLCHGKHDALNIQYEQIISSNEDDERRCSVCYAWLCPKDKRGIAMKSLWELLQSGVTRIARMPDPSGLEEARQECLNRMRQDKKAT